MAMEHIMDKTNIEHGTRKQEVRILNCLLYLIIHPSLFLVQSYKKQPIIMNLKNLEAWFVTGSQHLYGEETLKQVAEHSKEIARVLDAQPGIPVKIVFKPTVKTPDEIYKICVEANTTPNCIGIIAWMHTFSPAKMWIGGLKVLQKPLLHLHTQYNRDIPWNSIDMDF